MSSYSLTDLRKRIIFPYRLTPSLVEMCGVHIGDGHLGIRPSKYEYLIQWSGSLRDDLEYYESVLIPLWKEQFNVDATLRKKTSDSTCELRIFSKGIVTFFQSLFELPVGKKGENLKIPHQFFELAKQGDHRFLQACIRGIVDTDFYFGLDRGYYELRGCFASKSIVLSLYDAFVLLGFSPTIRLDISYYNSSAQKNLYKHMLRIRKQKDIALYFRTIGSSNPKIYKRYKCTRSLRPGGVDT